MERKDQESVIEMKRKSVQEEGEVGMKKLSLSSSFSLRFGRICVFCGSSSGKRASYQEAVIELGNELVEKNIDLVCGGGSIGLMGLVSDVVRAGGRYVLGVKSKSLMPKEITGRFVGDVRVVSNMYERKAEMARAADAFIAMYGGYGTLEELFEVITWAQLGIHSKLVGILNVDGYYDSLLSFIDSAVAEEFISSKASRILISAPLPKELLRKLEEYVPERDELVTQQNWDVSNIGVSDSDPKHQIVESSS